MDHLREQLEIERLEALIPRRRFAAGTRAVLIVAGAIQAGVPIKISATPERAAEIREQALELLDRLDTLE